MRTLFTLVVTVMTLPLTSAHAFTRATFPGVIGMITINSLVGGQHSDSDADTLYNAMRVRAEDSMLGPGKTLRREDQSFNFICAQRPNDPTCTIIIKSGATGAIVNPMKKIISLEATGEEAAQFHEQFYLNSGEEFRFENTEGNFKIISTREKFLLRYQQ